MKSYFGCVVSVFLFGIMTLQTAWAFPSQSDIKAATDVVGDIVAEDIRAANAGKMAHKDVAAKVYGLVGQAESDAAKWVLFKHAFIQYAKASDYTKAGDVLSEMIAAFPDVPPQMVIPLIEKNCAKANQKNAPTISRIRKLMYMRQKCADIVASGKATKKAKAEAYCLMGNWEKGLEMLGTVGGEVAEMASAEISGKQPKHVIANFWWDYTSDLDTCSQFKAHAADIYKSGLVDGSIAGLYKTVAEKRIAEMSAVPVIESTPTATKVKGLVHRWSFNNNLRDSVGKSHGKADGSVSYKDGAVVLPGGGPTAGAINLGNKLLAGDKEFTLEIWAALNRIQYWSVIARLQYLGEKDGPQTYKNQCLLTWNIDVWPNKSCFVSPCKECQVEANWAIGEMYHMVIVGKKNSKGKLAVTYMRAKAADEGLKVMAENGSSSWPSDTIALWLGRSIYWDKKNADAAATYDEVRIWDRALTQEELEKSHKAGPNKVF